MLARYDFKCLTVRNICDESGVAYGSFYHHFGNKENALYQYIFRVFQEVMKQNPVPAWIHPDDYIKNCLWFLMVYGKFCDALGKYLVKYLYVNCSRELFADTFEEEIVPRINVADRMGYLDSCRNQDPAEQQSVTLLCKDLAITYQGVLLWWSNSKKENMEPVYETIEHLCFNMLYFFHSEKYQNEDFPHALLSEFPQFADSIVMDNIFTRKNV